MEFSFFAQLLNKILQEKTWIKFCVVCSAFYSMLILHSNQICNYVLMRLLLLSLYFLVRCLSCSTEFFVVSSTFVKRKFFYKNLCTKSKEKKNTFEMMVFTSWYLVTSIQSPFHQLLKRSIAKLKLTNRLISYCMFPFSFIFIFVLVRTKKEKTMRIYNFQINKR